MVPIIDIYISVVRLIKIILYKKLLNGERVLSLTLLSKKKERVLGLTLM